MDTSTPDTIRRVYAEADCLHDATAVEAALDRMGAAITADLEASNPLVLCVLHGGLVTAGQLLTRLDFPLQVDYLHATRYRGRTSGGELHWKAHPTHDLAGRAVLLVDDILDEGLTLEALQRYCREAGAAEVRTAVLVQKDLGRPPATTADYIGLMVENRYVFGCGMDYHDYLRNAPGIYAVKGS